MAFVLARSGVHVRSEDANFAAVGIINLAPLLPTVSMIPDVSETGCAWRIVTQELKRRPGPRLNLCKR